LNVIDAYGCYLETEDGQYMDWFMDCGVTPLGYRPNQLLYQIAAEAYPHLPNTVTYEKREIVAEDLCRLTHMDKVFFCNSGTESVETAIKIIRKWNHDKGTGRKGIWTPRGSFHGRTLGSLAAGDSAEYHYTGFQPLPSGFVHFEHPDEIDWGQAAGILLEPIAGNNDVREREWLQDLCIKAIRNEVPIAFDEVQSGSFRTGKFSAAEWYGIVPDIMCLGKGIGCGIPTAVTLARGEFADVLGLGTHYSTFGGSPLSVLGINTLLMAGNNGLGTNVKKQSHKIMNALSLLRYFGIKEVRGVGLMIAIEFEKGFNSSKYSEALFDCGMFIPTFRKNIMKLAPPLNISDVDVDKGITIINKSFVEAFGC